MILASFEQMYLLRYDDIPAKVFCLIEPLVDCVKNFIDGGQNLEVVNGIDSEAAGQLDQLPAKMKGLVHDSGPYTFGYFLCFLYSGATQKNHEFLSAVSRDPVPVLTDISG